MASHHSHAAVSATQRVHVCPSAEFFLNFPTISLFQWHPFTVGYAAASIGFYEHGVHGLTQHMLLELCGRSALISCECAFVVLVSST